MTTDTLASIRDLAFAAFEKGGAALLSARHETALHVTLPSDPDERRVDLERRLGGAFNVAPTTTTHNGRRVFIATRPEQRHAGGNMPAAVLGLITDSEVAIAFLGDE